MRHVCAPVPIRTGLGSPPGTSSSSSTSWQTRIKRLVPRDDSIPQKDDVRKALLAQTTAEALTLCAEVVLPTRQNLIRMCKKAQGLSSRIRNPGWNYAVGRRNTETILCINNERVNIPGKTCWICVYDAEKCVFGPPPAVYCRSPGCSAGAGAAFPPSRPEKKNKN